MATQIRIRWDRILAVILILISPLIISWVKRSIHIGPLRDIPIFGSIVNMPEAKALLLLALLLIGVLAIIRILKRQE